MAAIAIYDNPAMHPEYPHVHTWDWSGPSPIRRMESKRCCSGEDNGNILVEAL